MRSNSALFPLLWMARATLTRTLPGCGECRQEEDRLLRGIATSRTAEQNVLDKERSSPWNTKRRKKKGKRKKGKKRKQVGGRRRVVSAVVVIQRCWRQYRRARAERLRRSDPIVAAVSPFLLPEGTPPSSPEEGMEGAAVSPRSAMRSFWGPDGTGVVSFAPTPTAPSISELVARMLAEGEASLSRWNRHRLNGCCLSLVAVLGLQLQRNRCRRWLGGCLLTVTRRSSARGLAGAVLTPVVVLFARYPWRHCSNASRRADPVHLEAAATL